MVCSKRVVIVAGGCGAGGAAFGRVGGFAHVVNGFVRRIGADIDHLMGLRRTTEPGEFAPIELHLLAPHQLVEVKPGANAGQGESIRFGYAINIIGRDHGAGAGHVLHEKARCAGDMFAHEAGEHARPSIVDAAGAEAGDDPGGLAFEELPLGVQMWSAK